MLHIIPHIKIRTDSCPDALQHADGAALVIYLTEGRAGQQGYHRQDTAQLNTPAPLLSHTLPTTIKRHPFTLLLSQIRGIIIKVMNKAKAILEVNSKVWSCSRRKMPMRRNAVESLSTHLLRALLREKRAATESSDSHRQTQAQIWTQGMQSKQRSL